jgi:putative membrane protein
VCVGGRAEERVTLEDESSPETSGRRLVYFAAERTLMAWIRSALGLMALGFVIDRFGLVFRQVLPEAGPQLYPKALSFWMGTVMVALGVLMAAVAAVRYFRFARDYHRRGSTQPGQGIYAGVLFTVILALIGLAIVGFLIVATD